MTRMRVLLAITVAGVGMGSTAFAQDARSLPSQPPPPAASERIDVDRLPLDLTRLERRLRQTAEKEDWDGFKLRYTVEVFGTAPKLQFFEPKDVLPSGPIPYGAPTHQEMIEMMTPKEFRAPVMDFSGLMRWLQEKMK